MKISKLKKGMVLKNYKELCEVLEIEPKKANSKKAQLKELSLYVNYEQQGHKIYILNIYKTPKIKIDKRKTQSAGNNRLFIDDFTSIMVLRLMADRRLETKRTLLLSKRELFSMAELVNSNFHLLRESMDDTTEYLNLPPESTREFYNNNWKKLKETTQRGLNSCRGASILMHRKVLAVRVVKAIIPHNEFGDPIAKKLNTDYGESYETREATEEERHVILELEREATRELGCKNIQGLFLSGRLGLMKSLVTKRLKERNTNIIYYYEAYSIDVNKKALAEYYNDNLKNVNGDELEARINKKMVDSIKRATKNKHIKSKTKFINGDILTDTEIYQSQERYKTEQDKLTDIFICRNVPCIKQGLDNFKINKLALKVNNETDKLKIMSNTYRNLNSDLETTYKLTLDWEDECFDKTIPF